MRKRAVWNNNWLSSWIAVPLPGCGIQGEGQPEGGGLEGLTVGRGGEEEAEPLGWVGGVH